MPAATSGTIDLLVVDPDHDGERITEALVDELLRSASNKGCTVVETVRPDDPAGPRPAWKGWASTWLDPACNET